MPEHSGNAGMAALSICEALLLAMNDLQMMPEHEIAVGGHSTMGQGA
ncbi:hypothetical protein [Leisingera thetidis]|nr:hypothetical protein [Leisingera thetidis]